MINFIKIYTFLINSLSLSLKKNASAFLSLMMFPNVRLLNQNILKAVSKLIFLTKVNEICRHCYLSKNMSNDAFYFSVIITELEFDVIGFLACHFFIFFIRKLIQMLTLTLFPQILGSLTVNR